MLQYLRERDAPPAVYSVVTGEEEVHDKVLGATTAECVTRSNYGAGTYREKRDVSNAVEDEQDVEAWLLAQERYLKRGYKRDVKHEQSHNDVPVWSKLALRIESHHESRAQCDDTRLHLWR